MKLLSTRLIKSFELILVASILTFAFCRNIQDVPFHPDESQWIATSFYFESLLNSDSALPVWTNYDPSFSNQSQTVWVENYWTLTQPPLTRYIIAMGRLVGGYHVMDLNFPWQFNLEIEENEALGAMPTQELLWWSRLPMALLAATSGLLIFLFVKESAGRVAGYVFSILYILNPYLSITLRHAMGESSLLFFTQMATFAGISALAASDKVRCANHGSPSSKMPLAPLFWLVLFGFGAGLAGASKLNGLAILFAGVIIAILIYHVSKKHLSKSTGKSFLIRAIASLFLATGMVFIIVNPYLYPNPIYRTSLMIRFRDHEISLQKSLYPENVIVEGSRLSVLSERILQNNTVFDFPGGLLVNTLLFGVGMWRLISSGYKWIIRRDGIATSAIILIVALATVIPSLFTPLDWDRYYLYPVIFVTVCVAIGIGWIAQVGFRGSVHVWRLLIRLCLG